MQRKGSLLVRHAKENNGPVLEPQNSVCPEFCPILLESLCSAVKVARSKEGRANGSSVREWQSRLQEGGGMTSAPKPHNSVTNIP